MIEFEKTITKHFDMSSLDETQVERLKVKYQEIAFKSIGLIQSAVDGSDEKIDWSYNGEHYYWYPTKRRTAIAQWYDPHTKGEIVFYPQGIVRSYITKTSGMTNQYFDKSYIDDKKITLSEMMKAVLGQIVTSRTIKSRRENLTDRDFLVDIVGGEEIFESMLITDEEKKILNGPSWLTSQMVQLKETRLKIENRRIS